MHAERVGRSDYSSRSSSRRSCLPRPKPRWSISRSASRAFFTSVSVATASNDRISMRSWGRSSATDRIFSASRYPTVATGIESPGNSSVGSAAPISSGSTPDEANSKSAMIPSCVSPGGKSRAVANLCVASCSTVASTGYPCWSNWCTSRSASESSAARTARSRSRVNRGSARAETAKPPTSANSCPQLESVLQRSCRADSSLVMSRIAASLRADLVHPPVVRKASHA
jgi:hypothetical protein